MVKGLALPLLWLGPLLWCWFDSWLHAMGETKKTKTKKKKNKTKNKQTRERPILIVQPPFRTLNSISIYCKPLYCNERMMAKNLVFVQSSNLRKEKGKRRTPCVHNTYTYDASWWEKEKSGLNAGQRALHI